MSAVFRPADRWARVTRWLLLGSALAAAAALVDTLLFLAVAWCRGQEQAVPAWLATCFQGAIIGRNLLFLLTWLATPIPFLVWCFRAHRNLPPLGNDRVEFGPWTSVLCYFVPIANLFWPVLTMRELWHGSDPAYFAAPAGHYGGLQRRTRKTPRLVWWWWASFVVSNLAIGAAEGIRENVVQTPELGPRAWGYAGLILIAAWSVRLGASLAAVRLVTTIDMFQRQRHAALQSQSAAVGILG